MIGIAENQFVSLKLTVKSSGGHSATRPEYSDRDSGPGDPSAETHRYAADWTVSWAQTLLSWVQKCPF